MESEIFSPPRDSVKCCDCACPTCSLIGKPSSTWLRSVKRKYDEFETGNQFYVPEFDLYSNPKIQIENECVALRETVSIQQATIQDLQTELEKERNASSSATNEAMSMILKLQKQKAEIQMEASQFKRFAEEKMAHDQEEILVLEDLLYNREQAVESVGCEALAYKHRVMSYSLTEAEAEGENDGEIQSMGTDENFDAEVDLPAYDYPPLKCSLNENPGDEIEDIEKYAFGETPNTEERLKDLEQRIFQVERDPSCSQMDGGFPGINVEQRVFQVERDPSISQMDGGFPVRNMEQRNFQEERNPSSSQMDGSFPVKNLEQRNFQEQRNPSSSQMDGCFPGTKNVLEKVIVGHSPRRTRQSRRVSTESYNSLLDKETASEFTIDSPRFNIGSPRFNASYKKIEFVSKMDEISNSRRMGNTSEVADDMIDRVYIIDSVHHGATYNETTLEPKLGAETADEYASTPRGDFNLPDACDPDIKKLYTRLQALEADRESMRQALLSMRTDKAQLVLLKEIAQHLSKEMASNRQVVAKPSILGSLPFMPVFKSIASLIFWRRKVRRSKYLYGLSPNNVGLLMLLDKGPRLGHWRCLSSTQV